MDLSPLDMTELADLAKSVDTLVVAGDIANDVWTVCKWLKQSREMYQRVIWVAGNHDFYNADFHTTKVYNPNWPSPKSVPEILNLYSKWSQDNDIVFLNRSSVTVDNITFLGATGWHDFIAGEPWDSDQQITAWYNTLSDTRIIWQNDQTKADHRFPMNAAKADADWLNSAVNQTRNQCVVITHHLPHRALKWEQLHDLAWTQMHGCFVNTMCEGINDKKIALWCYGHTHQRGMKTVNEVTYVCNSRGYYHENPSWQPIVLEV